MRPRLVDGNHSQARRYEDSWNMLVPIAVKVLYITMNTHTFEHIINEIDPEMMQIQLRHSTALICI